MHINIIVKSVITEQANMSVCNNDNNNEKIKTKI